MTSEWIKTPSHVVTLGILCAFVALAGLYSVITPAWEAPDEVGHFSFVSHLLRSRALPEQRVGWLGEAHQPPLYYFIAAVAALPADLADPSGAFKPNPRFMWAGQGGNQLNASLHTTDETFPYRGQALALHLARGASVVMGLLTVALTWGIAREILPTRPIVGALAAGLVALNPQFLFSSGAINNDNLLTLASTGAWWQLLRALKRPDQWRGWAYVGCWVAIAILAKMSGFVAAGMAGLALMAAAIHRRSLRIFAQGALALALPVTLFTGWWFVRNQSLYGDPFGWEMYRKVFAVNLRYGSLQWHDLRNFASTQFRSFWGVFGWMNVDAPSWFYAAARALCLVCLVGLLVFVVRRRYTKWSGFQKTALILLALTVLAQQAFMIGFITRCNEVCYQGRFLFPVIGPLMILLGLGLTNLLPERWMTALVGVTLLSLMGLALYMPFQVIRPAYPGVPLSKWRLWFLQHDADFSFGNTLTLKGYEAQVSEDRVSLTLYWQAGQKPDFDYSVFVHLIDDADALVAQKDHAPGEDRLYPPTAWWPQDIVADPHVLELPPELPPGRYRFRVGAYNWITEERLPVYRQGEHIGDFVVLDTGISR